MDLASLSLFAAALFLNAGSPGPSVAALVARVMSGGARSVLPFVAAMWIGEGLWLTAAVLGLSIAAKTFAWTFATLKYVGVAYLLYLAVKMWRTAASAAAGAVPEPSSSAAMFASGMAITLGNPKLMGFYLALLPALVDLPAMNSTGLAQLLSVMFAVLAIIDLSWIFAASYASRWLKSARAVRIANRLSATAMGGAAIAISTK